MMRQDRFALTPVPSPARGRGVSAAGGRGELTHVSPQNAKMPNKLVEYVAAPFRSPGVVGGGLKASSTSAVRMHEVMEQ